MGHIGCVTCDRPNGYKADYGLQRSLLHHIDRITVVITILCTQHCMAVRPTERQRPLWGHVQYRSLHFDLTMLWSYCNHMRTDICGIVAKLIVYR
jgi:hypothetical protein